MSTTFRTMAAAIAVAFLAVAGAPALAQAPDGGKPVKKAAMVKHARTSQKPRCDIYLCAAGSEPPAAASK